MEDEKLIEEIKGFGFVSGNIKHMGYRYKILLINNIQYNKYIEMCKRKDLALNAMKYIISQCLYREEEVFTFRQKIIKKLGFKVFPEVKKVFDFDIEEYPAVLTEKFTRDLFKILLDQDFFQRLVKEADLIVK